MNVQISIAGFSNVDDPATLTALRAAVAQFVAAAEAVGYPIRVGVSPAEEAAPPVPPTVTSVVPATALVGGPDLTVHVHGTGLSASSVILWNGGPEPTTYVSPTELTTLVKPSLVALPVTVPVSVEGAATAVTFTFTAAGTQSRTAARG